MIDYVVPFVFNDDPLWQADFQKAGRRYDESDIFAFVRYRSWGLEHLLIRCVKRFMPFIRNIYVILARESQWKDWMGEEGVKVIYHKDIIPERFLPVFNSRAIEMFMYRIPGLSERFIYGNDDMFPLAPMNEADFFEGDLPCLHHKEKPFPQEPNNFHLSCRNGLNFIARQFGKEYKSCLLKGGHSLTPMLKSTWELLWREHHVEMEESVSAFRETKNYNQWLCPWWHYFTGKYVDRKPERKYVSTKNTLEEVVNAVRNTNGIVCINDNESERVCKHYAEAVRVEIEKRLNA